MNPILQALNNSSQQMFNGTADDAKRQVLSMISGMSPQQRTNFNKMLPLISKIAQSKGVDTSELSELQSRM